MIRATRHILIMIFILSLVSPSFGADEATERLDPLKGAPPGVAPRILDGQVKRAEEEIAKRSALEQPVEEIGDIAYNEDGTIHSITYRDGTEVDYLYAYNERGELTNCTLKSGDTTISFYDLSYQREEERPGDIKITVSTPETAAGAEEKTVVLYCPKESLSLEQVARTPVAFDMGAIKESLADASYESGNAYQAYEVQTARYYAAVEEKLKDATPALEASSAGVRPLLKKAGADGASAQEKRDAIDEAVAELRGAERPDKAVTSFLAFEREARDGILIPARMVYETKVAGALESITKIIDHLLRSRIALYFTIDKDKIDIVINLPKAPPPDVDTPK